MPCRIIVLPDDYARRFMGAGHPLPLPRGRDHASQGRTLSFTAAGDAVFARLLRLSVPADRLAVRKRPEWLFPAAVPDHGEPLEIPERAGMDVDAGCRRCADPADHGAVHGDDRDQTRERPEHLSLYILHSAGPV